MSTILCPAGPMEFRSPGVQTPGAFTLIELLVVISVIALLIALLLPALELAREQARTVQCASNERQMGTATMLYIEDNEGRFPLGGGYLPTSRGWAVELNEYVLNEHIFVCPARIAPENFLGYWANGTAWMFWADWFGSPTNTTLDRIRSPQQVVLIHEDMEDLANPHVRRPTIDLGTANWGPSFHYSRYGGCCEARNHGGRHFTNGSLAAAYHDDINQSAGQDNILFVDGHVILVDMQGLLLTEGTERSFFSYPWASANIYLLGQLPPRNSAAPAGAQWWRVPWW